VHRNFCFSLLVFVLDSGNIIFHQVRQIFNLNRFKKRYELIAAKSKKVTLVLLKIYAIERDLDNLLKVTVE